MKLVKSTFIVLCTLSSAAALADSKTNLNVDGVNQSQSGALNSQGMDVGNAKAGLLGSA